MSDPYTYPPPQQYSAARYPPPQGSIAPQATNGQVPIDPALTSMYPSYYPPYNDQQGSSRQQASHLGLSNMHSPSDDSDSAASPAAEANGNGKRPSASGSGSNKKQRKDDDASQSPGVDKDAGPKPKPTRGSRQVIELWKPLFLTKCTILCTGRALFADG